MTSLLLTRVCFNADLCNEPAFTLNREAPSWHNAYGFATIALLSASFGLQGAAAEIVGTGVSRCLAIIFFVMPTG